MRLTALDIYQQDFRKRFRGFDTDEVESFLEVLARDFEELVQENNNLRNRITSLEEQIQEYRRKEAGIHEALLSVERYGEEARSTVERETELMIREARVQAESIIREANIKVMKIHEQITRLQHEKQRFIAQYRAALEAQKQLLHELQQMDFLAETRPKQLEAQIQDPTSTDEDHTEIEILEGTAQ